MIRTTIVDAVTRQVRLYLQANYNVELNRATLYNTIRQLYDDAVHSNAPLTVFESAVVDFIESKVRNSKRTK